MLRWEGRGRLICLVPSSSYPGTEPSYMRGREREEIHRCVFTAEHNT